MIKIFRLVNLSILLTVFLSACSSTPTPIETTTPFAQTTTQQINSLLNKAAESYSPQSETYLLDATGLLMQTNHINEASALLSQMNFDTLSPAQKFKHLTHYAKIKLKQGQALDALKALTGSSVDVHGFSMHLNSTQQMSLDTLRIQAYEDSGNFLAAVRERVFLSTLLPTDTRKENNLRIWDDLLRLNDKTLNEHAHQQASKELSAWIQLALLYKTHQHDIDHQLSALNHWLERWPTHPAARDLPASLKLLSKFQSHRPQHVALLLPFSGNLAKPARAIRDGFLSRFYDSKSRNNPLPKLSLYDTTDSSKTFAEHYKAASLSGADLIIGPLKKENVLTLQQTNNVTVPTLSLNYGDADLPLPANKALYQYGLPPEDETRQLAYKAFQDGFDNAAIAFPDNSWGYRVSQSFIRHWQNIGGRVIALEAYPSKKNYSPAIKSLLNIPASRARAKRIQRIIGEMIEFTPRRRKDIDFIVLLGFPNQIRQLKPGLAFYYAADIPVYSTSHAYEATNTSKNHDINGILFCDMPWILSKETRENIESNNAWPVNSSRYQRLYALGTDAFHLYPRLNILKNAPDSAVYGNTGTLQLKANGVIERELTWARIEKGYPQALEEATSTPEISRKPLL